MSRKIEVIQIKPEDRKDYPNLKSLSELKKMKLMPKKNTKPRGFVYRSIYPSYYLYDIEKTCPYAKTQEEKKKERLKRKETKLSYSCITCGTYLGVKKAELSKAINRGTVRCSECENQIKAKMQRDIKNAIELPLIPCKNITDTICFDVETTGLFMYDEVLQVSVIDGEGNTLINEYLKPYLVTNWPDAQAVNHISKDMVKDAPYPHELIPKIKGIFESADTWIAYNGSFDLGFLKEWGIQPKEGTKVVDVMEDFAPIYGEWDERRECYKWKSLGACAEYFNYEFQAHDSLEDKKATLYCHKQIEKINLNKYKQKEDEQ